MKIMWLIGERLRERRKKANLDAKDVASEIGISKSYLSMLETGNSKPNWELLSDLSKKYGVSADYLLGLTDDPAMAASRELPSFGVELLEIARQLPNDRREELLRIGEVLLQLSQQQTARLQMYDQMMALIEQIGGDNAVEALETALRAHAAGDPAQANRLIDAFFAGRSAKQPHKKATNQT